MNELARKRELDILVEKFPRFKQERVKQALKSAGSDLEKPSTFQLLKIIKQSPLYN